MSTNPPEKMSIRYVCEMCRLSEAELNCVRMNIRRSPACRQLLMGMSISLYLPPIGTAGLERMSVSGKSRFPRPPPRMMARTSCMANRVGEPASGGKPKGRAEGRAIRAGAPARPQRAGSLTVKTAPPDGRLAAFTSPPRMPTRCFTIERPRPVPPDSRERALSTR